MFDDTGDGPVTASLRRRGADGTETEEQVPGAWLLVGPPDFDRRYPLVSLYDVLFDLAARELAIPSDESVYRSGELTRLSGLVTLVRSEQTPSYTSGVRGAIIRGAGNGGDGRPSASLGSGVLSILCG